MEVDDHQEVVATNPPAPPGRTHLHPPTNPPPRCPIPEHAAANDGENEVFLGHAAEGTGSGAPDREATLRWASSAAGQRARGVWSGGLPHGRRHPR